MAGYVNQLQHGIRRAPIAPKLEALLDAVGKEANVYFDVTSGGQNESTGRTGSHRHDNGGAADVKAYTLGADGSKHYLDQSVPADNAIWQQIVKLSVAGGATGVGAGPDYMGNMTAHIGFGKPSVWGAGGHTANAPGWLKTAYNSGQHTPPGSLPQVGTALDTIDRAFPRPMPSQIASAYAATPRSAPPLPQRRPGNIDAGGFNMAPPALPLNAPLPPNRGSAYGSETGQWGPSTGNLGLPPLPSSAAVAAPTQQEQMREQLWARNEPLTHAGAVGTPPPVPMPGRPVGRTATPPAPRQTATVQSLPQNYTINHDAVIDAAKKAGVISGPASWLPDDSIWNGAFGQPGMRARIEESLPSGSYLDQNTVHVNDPDAMAHNFVQKLPPMLRDFASGNIVPAVKAAEASGFVTPQWPPSQTIPMPVPRPTPPPVRQAPVVAPTLQDTMAEQMAMRRAPTPPPPIPVMPFALPPNFYVQAAQQHPALPTGYAVLRTPQQVQAQQRLSQFLAPAQRAPVPQNRPSIFSMPQQQAPQHQTYQQAQSDLRDSGMIDQFGMIRM